MSLLFKTQYKPSEVKEILKNKLKSSTYFNWNEEIYIGKVHNNRFQYFFYRPFKTIVFTKLIGKIYEYNDDTYIKVKFVSILLDYKMILIMHGLVGLFFVVYYLINNNECTFLAVIFIAIFGGFVSTPFFLFIAMVETFLPKRKITKERLLAIIKDDLLADEIFKTK